MDPFLCGCGWTLHWHSLSKSPLDALREGQETPKRYEIVSKLANFGIGACTKDTFLITFSETLLEGLSNGSKDMAKEDDRKARGREPAKRQCRMRREGKRGSWSKGAKENG